MKQTVCTLCESHEHPGAGALINSLHAAGFVGRVICGYRGREPFWAEAARGLAGDIDVRFVPVTTAASLGRYKPVFMQECWAAHSADAQQLYYFDPGLVVKAPWPVLARWAAGGVAVCEQAAPNAPETHARALGWEEFLRDAGLPPGRTLLRKYHPGFIGLPRRQRHLLEIWAQVIASIEQRLGGDGKTRVAQLPAFLPSPDRDALDLALMVFDVPIVSAGPDGRDFSVATQLLSRATGPRQPWRAGFLRDALRRQPTGFTRKSFFRFAGSPLRFFSGGELARPRLPFRSSALPD